MAISQRPSRMVGANRKPRGRFGYRGRALVEDFSDDRAAILRRYLEVAPGARPFFTIDKRAPLADFERIVDQYPVFRVA